MLYSGIEKKLTDNLFEESGPVSHSTIVALYLEICPKYSPQNMRT